MKGLSLQYNNRAEEIHGDVKFSYGPYDFLLWEFIET